MIDGSDVTCLVGADSGIALVGGNGFVGRAVRARARDEFVVVPLADLPADLVIVHLAARADPTWESYASNIAIDAAVVHQAEKRGAAGVVYASTNNVYPLGLDRRVDERPRPADRYGVAKVAGEDLVRTGLPGTPTTSLRIADVIGVGQRYGNLYRAIEAAVASGSPLRRYGTGLKLRSIILVDELADVILHAASLARDGLIDHETWNVCHEGAWTVTDMIDHISSRQGLPIDEIPVDGDASEHDRRTMVQSAIPGYTYKHTLPGAIDAWLDSIVSHRTDQHA